MSNDQNGSSGGSGRRPNGGFDVTHALLHKEILNKDGTRRTSISEAVFEAQLEHALDGDTRAAEWIISYAKDAGIWHAKKPADSFDPSKLSDDELNTLIRILRKALGLDPNGETANERVGVESDKQ